MQFLDNLFGPQVDTYQRAMSLASQRHGLLVENLANVNVPGYKRKDLDFNLTLEQANGKLDSKLKGPGALGAQDNGSIRLDGNSVDLESEVMNISETEVRYQALTNMTVNYFTNLKNVIKGGI